MKKWFLAILLLLITSSFAFAGWEGPGFYMLAGGTNVHYFTEQPGNPNITFLGGFDGSGSAGNSEAYAKAFAKALAQATAKANAIINQNIEMNSSIVFQRNPMDTIQPNNYGLPLIGGETWAYDKKWGVFFEGEKEIAAPTGLKTIELYQYVFDPLEWLMFRKMRAYDVEKKLLAIAQDRGTIIEVKVRCMDGSEASGTPFFFGGGGVDHTGLSSATVSAMPTKNWAHSSAVCVILEYIR